MRNTDIAKVSSHTCHHAPDADSMQQFVKVTEFQATLRELKVSIHQGLGEAITASLTVFAGHVEQQLEQCRTRISVLEETVSRMESFFPSAHDKQAFMDVPLAVGGTCATILERQCMAVKTIQSSWRSFLGWSLGKACAQKAAVHASESEVPVKIEPAAQSTAPMMTASGTAESSKDVKCDEFKKNLHFLVAAEGRQLFQLKKQIDQRVLAGVTSSLIHGVALGQPGIEIDREEVRTICNAIIGGSVPGIKMVIVLTKLQQRRANIKASANAVQGSGLAAELWCKLVVAFGSEDAADRAISLALSAELASSKGNMSINEFLVIARVVRDHLPHIQQQDPPMLMLCDGMVTLEPMDENAFLSHEDHDVSENCHNAEYVSNEDEAEVGLADDDAFVGICETLSQAYPDASNACIASAAMHIWHNDDTDTARRMLESNSSCN